MKQRSLIALVAVVTIAALPIACNKKKEPENPQPFVAGTGGAYNQGPYGGPTGTPTGPATGGAATTPTTTPTTPTATGTGTGPAQPTVLDPAVQTMLRQAMRPLAQQKAAGMRPEGDMLTGVLQEGQTLEMQTMLQPGKCYTVVGAGMPMISELDIQMLAVAPIPGAPGLPMAQDNTQGAQTALAPTPNCYKYALPLPAQVKIIVKATAGGGPVGAQLYVK
ncbi:MAG: hypothetical protein MUF54_24915 [Polyangiaceae bacterium]|jgi:hypothetical protein|nr:hypothetical protein [Polyangiaceae bacterium]